MSSGQTLRRIPRTAPHLTQVSPSGTPVLSQPGLWGPLPLQASSNPSALPCPPHLLPKVVAGGHQVATWTGA